MSVPNPESGNPWLSGSELDVSLDEARALFEVRQALDGDHAKATYSDEQAESTFDSIDDDSDSIPRGSRLLRRYFDPSVAPDTYLEARRQPRYGTHEHAYLEWIAVRRPVAAAEVDSTVNPVTTSAFFLELKLLAGTTLKYLATEEGIYAYEDARETVHKSAVKGADDIEVWIYTADDTQWQLDPLPPSRLQEIVRNSQMVEQR